MARAPHLNFLTGGGGDRAPSFPIEYFNSYRGLHQNEHSQIIGAQFLCDGVMGVSLFYQLE